MSFERKKQAKRRRYRGPQQVADVVSGILNPVMQQRAGMTTQLVMIWQDIAGANHSAYTRPEKLEWPRAYGDDDAFKPATLIIACDGARAVYLQHDTAMIIGRVNTFFGFAAVDRVKIVQKPVVAVSAVSRKKPPVLNSAGEKRLNRLLADVDDEELRAALKKMGRGVFSSSSQ